MNFRKIIKEELKEIINLLETKIGIAYIGSDGRKFYIYDDKEKVLLRGSEEDIIDSLLVLSDEYDIRGIEDLVYDARKNKRKKIPVQIDYNILKSLI